MRMDIMKERKPMIIVFAGPNGSGKSSVTSLAEISGEYINADEIKKALHCSDMDAAKLLIFVIIFLRRTKILRSKLCFQQNEILNCLQKQNRKAILLNAIIYLQLRLILM